MIVFHITLYLFGKLDTRHFLFSKRSIKSLILQLRMRNYRALCWNCLLLFSLVTCSLPPDKDLFLEGPESGLWFRQETGLTVMGGVLDAVEKINDLSSGLLTLSDLHAYMLRVDPANFKASIFSKLVMSMTVTIMQIRFKSMYKVWRSLYSLHITIMSEQRTVLFAL